MAARIKALVKPALITWARESAGFGAAEAAARLNVEEAQLADWENPNSESSPSIPQLRKMAALYKRPLAVFFLDEVPKGFMVIRDLRRLPGTGLRHYSPALQMEIRAANERRELALELAADLAEEPPKFTLSATDKEDPEVVGARIRTALSVTAQLQYGWKDADGRAGFNAWRSRIEAAGVLVFQTVRFTIDEASGFAISADTLPVIAVNRKDPLTRRTFSLLHELAHLMLHLSGVSDIETDENRPPEDQKIEVYCNHVAAATLVPKDDLLANQLVRSHAKNAIDWNDAEIAELAKRFNVSREALLRRLLAFGMTTNQFYQLKRAQYIAEYQAQQKKKKEESAEEEMKRNMPQETVSNLGKPLVRMLLDNYYQDRLTLSEVSGYLGLKVKHIPKLERAAGTR
jgi:Zn-dependent peptidase ImmA (M78 family)/transcriptional regulator with XRE-family HTH domain